MGSIAHTFTLSYRQRHLWQLRTLHNGQEVHKDKRLISQTPGLPELVLMSSSLPQNVKHNVSVYILLHWNLDLSFYKFVIQQFPL